MPNRDKTGPEGKGPRTGRLMGDCKESKKDVTRIDEIIEKTTKKAREKGTTVEPKDIVNNILKK